MTETELKYRINRTLIAGFATIEFVFILLKLHGSIETDWFRILVGIPLYYLITLINIFLPPKVQAWNARRSKAKSRKFL